MDHRDNITTTSRSARRPQLTCGALIVLAFIAIASLDATAAPAASWEQVGCFGGKEGTPLQACEPILPPPEKESEFPEDTRLGGVSGMAVNATGAGGVPPGTVYTIGRALGTPWHVARYSEDGEFELAWTAVSRCGPNDVPPSTCPPLPTGVASEADVAVDQTTGNVYVFTFEANEHPKVVREYKADGTGPIAEFGELDATGTAQTSPGKIHGSPGHENIAVDASGNVYVADEDVATDQYHRVMVFEPCASGYCYAGKEHDIGGGFTNVSGATNPPSRPMVDDDGHVYVSGESYIEEYDPAQPSTPICTFNFSKGGILSAAVNPETGAVFYFTFKDEGKTFYLIHQLSPCNGQGEFIEDEAKNPPFKVEPKRHFLKAMTFNPVGQLPEYSSGILYAGAPSACPPTGFFCPPESRGQSSLGYIFASKPNPPAPVVESESVSNVGVTNATLNAQVNPNGTQTRFVFQYITDAAYQANDLSDRFVGAGEAPANGAVLGSGQKPQLAAAAIAGLSPATTYHYRVVASSSAGIAVGSGALFQTRATEAAGPPDSRAYELVSPAQKNGGEVLPAEPGIASCGNECKPGVAASRFPVAVSPSGATIAYQGQPFLLNEGALEFDEYVSTRTASGWQTASMSPPLVNAGAGLIFEAFGFDSSLGRGLSFATNEALVPEAPAIYRNIFSEPAGNRFDLSPLLTVTPPNRLPTGAEAFKIRYAGASPDLSRVFFEANDALTGPTDLAPAAVNGGSKKFNLYEWHAGQLSLVNVQPFNAETIPGAAFGSGFQLAIGSEPRADYSNAIAANGALVFWSSESGQVYVRENGELTRKIPDLPGHNGKFLSASVDGSKVLLNDGVIYDLQTEALTDLTEGSGGFEGIAGQSDDLSHIYFVVNPAKAAKALTKGTGDLSEGSNTITEVHATSGTFAAGQTIEASGIPAGTTIVAVGVKTLKLSAAATVSAEDVALTAGVPLGADEENSEGAKPKLSAPNLYAWHEGTVSFVATLAKSVVDESITTASPVLRTAEASPDGRWLTFSSAASLTGANTVGACHFDGTLQKWVGPNPCSEVYLYNSQTGSLICASCSPTGASPLGPSFLRLMTNAPGSLPQPRYLTNDGRLYFDTQDQLSSLDTNGQVEDVYQYEPDGIGSCVKAGGCVGLISSGRGSYDSNFLAIDATGDNVFFTTRQQLVPRDQDALIDLYDARVGGGIAADHAAPPTECLGEGCQSPPPPLQGEPSPGSAAFQGPGNLKPKKAKKKHHKKKHHKHRKTKGKRQGSNAAQGRGGSK